MEEKKPSVQMEQQSSEVSYYKYAHDNIWSLSYNEYKSNHL